MVYLFWPLRKLYWHSHIDLSIAQRWKTSTWYSRTIWHKTTPCYLYTFPNSINFQKTGSWSISAKTVLWRLSLTAWWTHLAPLIKNSFVRTIRSLYIPRRVAIVTPPIVSTFTHTCTLFSHTSRYISFSQVQ